MGSEKSTKSTPGTARAVAENSDANALRSFPFYEEGKVPQYQKYHAKVSYLDELELIWGKRWGAQGIGRLREVAIGRRLYAYAGGYRPYRAYYHWVINTSQRSRPAPLSLWSACVVTATS